MVSGYGRIYIGLGIRVYGSGAGFRVYGDTAGCVGLGIVVWVSPKKGSSFGVLRIETFVSWGASRKLSRTIIF